MKKFLLSIIVAVCCLTASADTTPATEIIGNKTFYKIGTLDELTWFANHVNVGNTTANAILTADITVNNGVLDSNGNLNGDGSSFSVWTPIGGHGVDYSGEFNGNGHTISGLYFNSASRNNVGIFGKANNGAYIHDLGLKDSYFSGNSWVAGICGDFASGRIENCWNGATVIANSTQSGGSCAGGITASCWTAASIRGCYNIGKISVASSNKGQCGGICGTVAKNTGVDCSVSYCVSLEGKCDSHKAYNLYNDAVVENVITRNSDAFESGEVCYLLNSGVTNGSQKWYQTLGTDTYPVLDNSRGIVFYGYEGDVLKYSNSEIYVNATHREVCAATCNAVGYTRECWEDTKSGKIFAEATCATELNAAYVTTYSPVMTVPEYDYNLAAWRWRMNNESVTYDGVTFINPLEKVYSENSSYISSEYVWFKVKDATAMNVRLKWHLNKNTFNGELYYKINDGDESKIDIPENMWVQNLPDLKQDDIVTVYYKITGMWSFPLTWTMSLEYCPGHSIEHVEAKDATCTKKGNYENWYCKKCDKHFADAECTTVMTDWEIPALGHTTEYRAQKDATCTEDGYTVSHWHCTVCGRNYADEACTNQITGSVVLPKLNHQNKQHQARIEATCLTDGNIEYWHCPDCSTYFTNEACTASTTDYIIAALGHDFTYTPYRTSTCTSEGDVEHWHCNRCGKDFNVSEQMASEDHVISGSLTIPCKESDVILVGMDEGKIYDDCHTFTPPTEGEGETLIATVTFDGDAVKMKVKNGEETAYSLNEDKPLETFFAHTFKLEANQDPDHPTNYYSTFFTSERAYKVPTDGSAKAYAGVVNDEQLNMTNIGSIIHQREPVILKANQSDIILMPSCNTQKASIENILKGIDEKTTLKEGDYAMTLGQNGVGFYKWTNKQLGAHKAYMKLDGMESNAFTFLFDEGTTTGINSVNENEDENENIYNLNGVRVGKDYKGIVGKGGKKYFNK